MTNHYVYILLDPRKDLQPFYVGMSSNIGAGKNYRRAFSHGRGTDYSNNPIKNAVIRKILEAGVEPKVEIFKENLSKEEAASLEKELIAKWGRIDLQTGILTNMTDGGEGTVGFIHTPETRQKRATSNKGNHPWNYNVPWSDEMKEKLKESQSYRLGKTFEDQYGEEKAKEIKERLLVSQCRPHAEETKQKISNALKGKKRSPEAIENHRIALAEYYQSEKFKNRTFPKRGPTSDEMKKKISDSLKGRKHSPETIEKIRQKKIERDQKKRNGDLES